MAENQKHISDLGKWALEQAGKLAPSLTGLDRMRIAVGLIEARATECLHYSGKFATGDYIGAVRRDICSRIRGMDLNAGMAIAFSDRHAHLSEAASRWAQQYLDENESKVVLQ